jgi:hypothetical protein
VQSLSSTTYGSGENLIGFSISLRLCFPTIANIGLFRIAGNPGSIVHGLPTNTMTVFRHQERQQQSIHFYFNTTTGSGGL